MSIGNPTRGRFKSILKITVRDKDGKVIAKRKKVGDLFLRNFANWLALLLNAQMESGHEGNYTFKDTSGTEITLNPANEVGGGYSPGTILEPGVSENWKANLKIVIGTGTTAPTVDDYKLAGTEPNYIAPAPYVQNPPTIEVDGDKLRIKFGLTIEATDFPMDIGESGVEIVVMSRDIDTVVFWTILICRDTFTPVSVPSGGSITVEYTWEFN